MARVLSAARCVAPPGQVRKFIAPAYSLAKKIMPRISATEEAALMMNAGSADGFDREIFSGMHKRSHMLSGISHHAGPRGNEAPAHKNAHFECLEDGAFIARVLGTNPDTGR